MKKSNLFPLAIITICNATVARAELEGSCASVANLKIDGVEISKAALVPKGSSIPPPYPGAPSIGPLPAHCCVGGGPHFDMLNAVANRVEKGTAADAVIATGKAFPGRSRPLCAYPEHVQSTGSGDSEDARNFSCQ